jgi:hypothetical protein
MARKIFSGARIFDGERFHDDKALSSPTAASRRSRP